VNKILKLFATVGGPYTIRQLALVHAAPAKPGGKNYRLVQKLIDGGVLFQIGDNLYINGIM
jgi:hypothetical protein